MNSGKILITGAGGCIGQNFMKSVAGRPLVVASSRPGLKDKENTTYFHADFSDKKTHEADFWSEHIEKNNVGVIVNLAGGAYAPFGGSLQDINLHPVAAMATASKNTGAHLVQISSMAALKVFPTDETDYSKTKYEAEERVRETTDDYTIVRPDLVFADHSTVSMRHAFSPNEVVTLPGPTVVLGKGYQTLQPVGLGDTVQGLKAIAENPGKAKGESINFLGPDIISQIGLFSMLKEARGESFFPAKIEFDSCAAKSIKKLATLEPFGSFNPSLMGALENGDKRESVAGYDNRRFIELLDGKELTSLSSVLDQSQLKFIKPPVAELAGRVLKNPEAIVAAGTFVASVMPSMVGAIARGSKQYMNNGTEKKRPLDIILQQKKKGTSEEQSRGR